MEICWILQNRIDYFSSYEVFTLGVFRSREAALAKAKSFVKSAGGRWEADGENSFIRVRRTRKRLGDQEVVYLEESILDGVSPEAWKDRVKQQTESEDG